MADSGRTVTRRAPRQYRCVESPRPAPEGTGLGSRSGVEIYFLISSRMYIDGSVPGPYGRTRMVKA